MSCPRCMEVSGLCVDCEQYLFADGGDYRREVDPDTELDIDDSGRVGIRSTPPASKESL
jgi:hypothetical protein